MPTFRSKEHKQSRRRNEKDRKDLDIPDNFDVMAMIAIGKMGTKENLPQQLQEREHPNDRKPLAEIIMEGQFRK
jgi:hypothetical protein